MNRKICHAVIVTVCLIALAGCSSGNPNPLPNLAPVMAVTAESGTPQSHAINSAFGTVLVAMVTSNGLPANGVVVTFSAPTTGPSGTFAGKGGTTATATTDANGFATSPAFTANGVVGLYTVTASAPNVPTPAIFDLTNTTGAPASITATAGNNQSATVDAAFTNPLQVTVVDGGNNPVSNAMVVFTAPATGASGTFANSGTNTTTAMTNASGVAVSSAFTANGVAGADNVIATVSGTSSSATFSLTNVAGSPATVTATTGTPQSAIADKAYLAPLSALVVDSLQNPVAGTVVTFAAPTTGQSVTFANTGTNTTTATTGSNGVATSAALTANGLAGTFAVTASASGASANFTLTNWPLGSQYYSFYLSGQEDLLNGGLTGFYSLAGSVLIDPTGAVLEGEQDYNDGVFVTSPEPSGDTISGGSLTVSNTTGQGTLVLDTNNRNAGVNEVETFAVQFANSNHALIAQYDGSATSSGSFDLQTLPSPFTSNLNGGYAFALTGTDVEDLAVSYGGVFSITGGGTTLQNGLLDTNDSGIGVASTGAAMSGTLSLPDSFGRGTISIPALNYNVLEGGPSPVSLNYYIVGPEVIRIIDVDTTDSAIGSAYGQGVNATTASNSSLGNSIFGLQGNFSSQYGAAGMLAINNASATFSGVADDNEITNGVSAPDATISPARPGTYSIADTGYGSLTIPFGDLGDVSALGLYMTDPNLNLLDPNNTATGVGGALLLDLDVSLAGGTGVVIPQTDTSTSVFTGDYAFGGQDPSYTNNTTYAEGEFDFVGMATVTSGAFSGSALISDPYLTLGGTTADSAVKFSSTPLADPSNAGRYTMLTTNSPKNPLKIKLKGVKGQPFNVVMYQANGDQFLWLDEDSSTVFLGSLQQLGSFTTLPATPAQGNAK